MAVHPTRQGEGLGGWLIEGSLERAGRWDRVLLVGSGEDVRIGTPLVEGGKVTAEVLNHGRHEKVKIIKFNRRKHHRKQAGHRQWFTEVKITGISG